MFHTTADDRVYQANHVRDADGLIACDRVNGDGHAVYQR
jgi:hypothetical protein